MLTESVDIVQGPKKLLEDKAGLSGGILCNNLFRHLM